MGWGKAPVLGVGARLLGRQGMALAPLPGQLPEVRHGAGGWQPASRPCRVPSPVGQMIFTKRGRTSGPGILLRAGPAHPYPSSAAKREEN